MNKFVLSGFVQERRASRYGATLILRRNDIDKRNEVNRTYEIYSRNDDIFKECKPGYHVTVTGHVEYVRQFLYGKVVGERRLVADYVNRSKRLIASSLETLNKDIDAEILLEGCAYPDENSLEANGTIIYKNVISESFVLLGIETKIKFDKEIARINVAMVGRSAQLCKYVEVDDEVFVAGSISKRTPKDGREVTESEFTLIGRDIYSIKGEKKTESVEVTKKENADKEVTAEEEITNESQD